MIKKIFILTLICLASFIELKAQNFDWQNSSRMPFEIPNLFIGGGGEYSNYLHKGNFKFIEKNTHCCGYESGNGSGLTFGLNVMYFMEDDLSLIAGIRYKSEKGIFKTQTTYPKTPTINITTEFQYTGELNYLSLETGVKKYILFDNFSLFGGFGIDILLNDNSNHIERIISPSNIPFNDGNYERSIAEGKISNLRKFMILPKVAINYDLNIGNETFASANTFLTLPLFSNLTNDNWRAWGFGLGFTIYKGIPK